MLATATHSDTGSLVWSPARDKMAYATASGLQVYISNKNTSDEQFVTLSNIPVCELVWSPDGNYLAGHEHEGDWVIFRVNSTQSELVYRVDASSLDWFDNDQVLYVPHAGGLVLVDLRATLNGLWLAG